MIQMSEIYFSMQFFYEIYCMVATTATDKNVGIGN